LWGGRRAKRSGWGGTALSNLAQDGFDHTVEVFTHFCIPKSENDIAFRFDGSVPPLIARHIVPTAVLITIEFDSHTPAVLGEIEEIATHRNLAAEMKAPRVQLSKLPPEQALHIASAAAQPPSAIYRSCF
jgi:hypothetical protein